MHKVAAVQIKTTLGLILQKQVKQKISFLMIGWFSHKWETL